ncbi:MAG: M56 family metallopeptidase [Anaerostipes sp.]|nr:M56 family metallopeptidase [Anaerostipes sp.]MDD3745317.1 M56 family metallopeptidase [Anaerostipes sp.]
MLVPSYGSVISCLLFGNILILYFYLQSKNHLYILKYGCHIVIISMVFLMLRMFFPCNFVFTYSIYMKPLVIPLMDFLRTEIFPGIQLLTILLYLSLGGFLIKLSLLLYQQYQFFQMIQIYPPLEHKLANSILEQRKAVHGIKKRIYLIETSLIKSPCITGFLHPTILLPDNNFSVSELTYILDHELQHYLHHDLWIRLLCELMVCFYWWNPLSYLLRGHLGKTLEFTADFSTTKSMDKSNRLHYMKCILDVADQPDIRTIPVAPLCFWEGDTNILEQRFTLILDRPDKVKKSLSYIINIAIITVIMFISIYCAFEPDYEVPKEITETTVALEKDKTFFIKNNGKYDVYYKGNYNGSADSVKDFSGYHIYSSKKEAKTHEKFN